MYLGNNKILLWKKDLIKEIDYILNYFSPLSKRMAQTIYKKYYQLKEKIETNKIKANLIKGSVRVYIDTFNDYENPILNKMSNLEKEIDLLIKTQDLTNKKTYYK